MPTAVEYSTERTFLAKILAALRKPDRAGQGVIPYRFQHTSGGLATGRTFQASIVNATATWALFLNQDPNRWALLLSAESGSAIRVWTKPLGGVGAGIFPPSTDYTEFIKEKHGDLVTSEWWFQSGVGVKQLSVIEIF